MTFDPKAWLAENLDANGDLAPPWARFPEIPAGSIGWRMGGGEGWKWAWWDWVKTLPADRESRIAYLRRHPPASRPWASSAMAVVDPSYTRSEDDGTSEADEARWTDLEEMLEREGLVGDDVAFGAWVARHPLPEPPWRRNSSLASEVRYGSRELTFLCRWAAQRRADALGPWLSRVETPPHDWWGFITALREGAPPAILPHEPRERLGVLLAAAGGRPPPPWMGDEDPAAMEREFEEETTHAGAWSEWALDVFDDAATFAAYRAAFPAALPPWERAVEENFRWLL